ncbi:hypothetical protein [Streptomyces fradiae]|uniref:hypothetical protein n=1 Tax=Streptomyces fradiae TaxID=1906 RepID=UPI003518967A
MSEEPTDEERSRRIRRAGILGGVIGAGVGGVVMGAESLNAVAGGFPWWVVAPFAVAATAAGAWGGARLGREHRVRADSLEPGETVLNEYGVWHAPAPPPSRTTQAEHAPYQLRTTTRRMQLWEGSTLLWEHPYHGVVLEADGPRLRVLHGGVAIALLETSGHPEMPETVRLVASRIAARGYGRR